MTNRVIVVTGSTSGIGYATARRFCRAGDKVMLHGLDDAYGATVVQRLRADVPNAEIQVLTGDLRDPTTCTNLIQAAVDGFGQINVMVNNAGAGPFIGVMETDVGQWDASININLRAAWLCAQAAVPHMPPGSSVINIASNHAFYTMPGAFPYNTGKAGLLALTQSLAIELGPLGIRANAVCPGRIVVEKVREDLNRYPDPEAEERRLTGLHPIGRLGEPGDIAEAVLFLASEERAGFITGTQLTVDGGRSTLMDDPRPE